MKILAPLIAALTLAGAACSASTGEPTDCTGAPATGSGPLAVCAFAFTCDSGSYGISCTTSGADYACRCTDATASQGQPFSVGAFPCTTEGALEAVNGYCDFGLTLAE